MHSPFSFTPSTAPAKGAIVIARAFDPVVLVKTSSVAVLKSANPKNAYRLDPAAAADLEQISDEKISLSGCWNHLHIYCLSRGVSDVNGPPLGFKSLQKIRIQITKGFEGFPAEEFVVAGRDARHGETPVLIRAHHLVQIGSISAGWNENGLDSWDALTCCAGYGAVDLRCAGAHDDVECSLKT